MANISYSPVSRSLLAIALMLAIGFNSGCSNNSIDEVQDLETISLYSQTDQLAQTMEYIRSVEQYEENKFRDKVNSGLNRWANDLSDDKQIQWQPTEMLSTLPEKIDTQPFLDSLDNKSYSRNDADYVQQAFWCREIAQREVASNLVLNQEYIFRVALKKVDDETRESWEDSDNLLLEAIKVNQPELVVDEDAKLAEKLTQAIKLFDWTVRNVHQQDALPWPDKEIVETRALDLKADPSNWPATTGTPGPGYIHYPWQTFRYGLGDYLDRAKIFTLLCQQMDIPVTVLAVPSEEKGRPYQEWVCAAAIGGKLYLFDTQLGLPIPGKREGTVATLDEVKSNAELLTDLNLTPTESPEKTDYAVTVDQLDNVTALIYAGPEAISRRMRSIEENLVGDNRMRLSINVDEFAKQFENIEGIGSVALWHVPYSTAIYRDQVLDAIFMAASDGQIGNRLRWLVYDQEMYIDRFVSFRTARTAFLRGIFESDRERGIRSCVSYFYRFMYTDQEISELQQNSDLQMRLGILKETGQSFAQWNEQLKFFQLNMRKIRADAAFFMAMAQFENGIPQTSLNWLERVSQYDDTGRWGPFYNYHAGRAYEAGGQYRSAIESYKSDKSAQRHGSILRARLVQKLADEKKAAETQDAS